MGDTESAVTMPVAGPLKDPAILRLVRSAAHVAECPLAVLLRCGPEGAAVLTSFGFVAAPGPPAGRLLAAAASPDADGLLIIDDLAVQPGFGTADAALFGTAGARFVAAVSIAPAGAPHGLLLVADPLPHAGLSAARTYVLRTLAAQLAERLGEGAAPAGGGDAGRLRLLEAAVLHAVDAVLVTEASPLALPGPRIVYCNPGFTRTTGYPAGEVIGRTPRFLQSEATDRRALDRLRQALEAWQPIEIELLNRKRDGTDFWVELSIVPITDEGGRVTHWVSVQRDVSDRKRADEAATRARIAAAEQRAIRAGSWEQDRMEAQLAFVAFHDPLTKLHNRSSLVQRLDRVLRRDAGRRQGGGALLFLDLDRFRLVNDGLGRRAGDLLLMQVAHRLREAAAPDETLARLGADTFGLLIEAPRGAAHAIGRAERILLALQPPVRLGTHELFVSASIGVVADTAPYADPERALRDAEAAIGESRRQQAGGFSVFTGALRDDAAEALELLTDLRHAIARTEFELRYQPICDAATGAMVGVEALLRWRHPRRGLLAPGAFVGPAEETGLIRPIGRWVLGEACGRMAGWDARHPGRLARLNVNSSAAELADPGFVPVLRAVLAETGLDPRRLQIEITETVLLQQPERIGALLAEIRGLGVRVALDDFGTGYSSLSHLDHHALDCIKIDRSFVGRMLSWPAARVIVEALVRLGEALSLDVVAEGVETDAQLGMLRQVGCRLVQGYLLGMPMTAPEIDALLAAPAPASAQAGSARPA